ncbi:MAG: ATP synthase F0 subunit C [Candidatus Auribacterota bacterium]|jgi:ATP synthase F0 subunit c|nr:ATP synthase F0 subunit C [Candidatus Auribacterota bacterium]
MQIDESVMKMATFFAAALSMGIGAIGSAYGLGYASSKACEAIARQPQESGKIIKMMLIGQAASGTPSIFSLLISFLLLFGPAPKQGLVQVFAILGAGICMGAGAVGPGIGAGFANAEACDGVARMPDSETTLLRVMLMGQAVSQSTSIYALVIAFLLTIV